MRSSTRAAFCLLLLVPMAIAQQPQQPPTGRANPALAGLDRAMTDFMKTQNIPGGALAISRGGQLVYARGFGYADLDAKTPVQPTSLFRIASISKPFTAVAVLQLIEQKKFNLDDKAFALLGVAPHLAPGDKPDPRIDRITIRNLLNHTSGWDQEVFDPMFRPGTIAKALGVASPPGSTDIIRFTLGRPLDFDPGSKYAYANFNYNVLGRLIEKFSGMPYEQDVRQNVLKPLGIRTMRLGHTLEKDRAPGEVTYYEAAQDKLVPALLGDQIGKPVPRCYGGFYLEAMDSHGGWIASAPDLVRFASAFDNFNNCRLLKPATIQQQMLARPPGAPGAGETFYACGWDVRPVKDKDGKETRVNFWHGGRLKFSTVTMLVRRADGTDYAILFNSGTEEARGQMDTVVREAIQQIKAWPTYDLFPAMLSPQ